MNCILRNDNTDGRVVRHLIKQLDKEILCIGKKLPSNCDYSITSNKRIAISSEFRTNRRSPAMYIF